MNKCCLCVLRVTGYLRQLLSNAAGIYLLFKDGRGKKAGHPKGQTQHFKGLSES